MNTEPIKRCAKSEILQLNRHWRRTAILAEELAHSLVQTGQSLAGRGVEAISGEFIHNSS